MDPTKNMVFSSIPAYLDPANWQQQPSHNINHINHDANSNPHQQLHQQQLQQQPPPPALLQPPLQPGSIRPGSMVERARMANIPMPEPALKCPRCESSNTKFCYFNNYSLTQPRHLCKTCRRYWTRGGTLRHNFFAHLPAGSGSTSISIDLSDGAFSRISGSVSYQTISTDVSHSTFTQTISNNGEVEITSAMVKSNQVQHPGGDEIEKCRSLTVSVKRSFRLFGEELNTDFPPSSARLPLGFSITVEARYKNDTIKFVWGTASSGIEGLYRKLAEKFGLEVGRFNIAYEDEDGDRVHFFSDEDLRFCLDTLKASKQSTLKLEIVTGFFSDQDVRIFNHLEYASTTMENGETDQGNNIIEVQDEVAAITQGDIPIEKINQHRGCTTQEDAAEKLNVSLSTLKPRCMELGLGRWPYSKRKYGDCLPSSPRGLKKTKGQCSIADAIENEDAATKSVSLGEIARDKSTVAGNDEFDRKNDNIAVLATYKDDTVRFPLYCNSGIEELRKELYDSFRIKGESIKLSMSRKTVDGSPC